MATPARSPPSPSLSMEVQTNYFPQFGPAMVVQDLWRTNEENISFKYYCESICAHRTVFTYSSSNSYASIIEERCSGVKAMRFCLAFAYLKVCIPSKSTRFAALEYNYYGSALDFLKTNIAKSDKIESILKIVWLLVHHQVVSEDQIDNREWSVHSGLLGILQSTCNINYQWALFPTYESILKLSRPKNGEANNGIDVGYLMEDCDTTLIYDFGCSRELLMLMGLINVWEVKTKGLWEDRTKAGRDLEARINAVEQWTKEVVEENQKVALAIADSYKISAQMNNMVRLLGYTKDSPLLQVLADELALLILSIPDESESFGKHRHTMQYPLQPTFWAIIFSITHGKDCLLKLQGISHRAKRTNTSRPSLVAEQILDWQLQNPSSCFVKHGWFEKMLEETEVENLSLG